MKKTLLAIDLAALLLFSAYGIAQTGAGVTCPKTITDVQPKDMNFCQNDSRPEVKAFCKRLAQLQVNATAHKDANDVCFVDLLDNVDITANADQSFNKALPAFIVGTAPVYATRSAIADVLREAGQARPDRQLSATSSASGTTSLVSKAGSAELLSLALDTGVLTQSINGTTATLTTNADQVFRLVTGNDPDCTLTCGSQGGATKFETAVLANVNVAATIDLAQTSNTTVTTAGQASGTTATTVNSAALPTGEGKISGITARYEVLNKYDPRGAKFRNAWQAQVVTLAPMVTSIGDDTEAVFTALKTHVPWSGTDQAAISSATQLRGNMLTAAKEDPSGTKLVQAFERLWNSVMTPDVLQDAKIGSAVAKVMQDRAVYRQAWFQAVADAAGTLLTFEYSYNHPLNQPYTNDFRIIGGYSFQNGGMLTFNGAFSLYGTIPAGARYGRLHYGQFSAEYDRTLTGQSKPLQTQLSLAGYWQYQPDPSILSIPAGTVAPGTTIPIPNGTQEFVGTAGSLWVTQAKITIKGAGGINVPIGVSWSNKTDLLQGSRVGAQVGISYNFSSLAGLFSGGQ